MVYTGQPCMLLIFDLLPTQKVKSIKPVCGAPTQRADLHACKPGHLLAPPPPIPISKCSASEQYVQHTHSGQTRSMLPNLAIETLPIPANTAHRQQYDAYRADMQQMEGKWSQWWRQSTDMCDNLQQQMALLTSQQEATAQRLDHLHHQVIILAPLSHPFVSPQSHLCLTLTSPLTHPCLAPM